MIKPPQGGSGVVHAVLGALVGMVAALLMSNFLEKSEDAQMCASARLAAARSRYLEAET